MLGGSRIPKNWKEKERKAESIARGKSKEGVRRQKVEGGGGTQRTRKMQWQ